MTRPSAAAQLSDVLFAVADEKRRRILDTLAAGEWTAGALCDLFDVSQPAISQHLEILRGAGLVSVRRDGRFRHYRLEAGPLRQVYDYAGHFERFWNERLDALGAVLDAEADRHSRRTSRRKKES